MPSRGILSEYQKAEFPAPNSCWIVNSRLTTRKKELTGKYLAANNAINNFRTEQQNTISKMERAASEIETRMQNPRSEAKAHEHVQRNRIQRGSSCPRKTEVSSMHQQFQSALI